MYEKLPIIFGSGRNIGSLAIKFWTSSQWSHVGILDEENGEVIELLGIRGEYGYKGCVSTPIEIFKERYKGKIKIAYIPCHNKEESIMSARSMVGKVSYDWWGIIAFPFRLSWGKNNRKFFCSEHVAYHSSIRKEGVHKISPEDIYKFSEDKE
jgi:hypothetical protein